MIRIIVGLTLFLCAPIVSGQDLSVGHLKGLMGDDTYSAIDNAFFSVRDSISAAFGRSAQVISKLVLVLGLIDVTIMFVMIAIRQVSVGTLIRSRLGLLMFLVLFLGFFKEVTGAVQYVAVLLGSVAAGGINGRSTVLAGPASFFGLALEIASPIYQAMINTAPIQIIPAVSLGAINLSEAVTFPNVPQLVLLMVSYLAVVIPYMIITLRYFEVFFKFASIVGFGGLTVPGILFEKTRFLASGFVGSMLAHAVEIMLFTFITTIAFTLSFGVNSGIPKSGAVSVDTVVINVVFAVVVLKLASEIPKMAAEISGGPMPMEWLK